MPVGDYLLGLALFTATAGSAAAAALLVTRRRMGYLRGSARGVALGLLGTAALIAAHLVPGALGVLSPWTAVLCAGLLAAVAWRLSPTTEGPEEARPALEEGAASKAAAALAVGSVALAALTAAWTQSAVPTTFNVDTLTFHLPNIARWIQTGSFWQVDQFIPLLAQGNYPQSGDVVFLSSVLPWDNDAFVRLVNWPFYALLGLGVYAVGRELAAPRAAAALFAAVFLAIPAVARTASAGSMTDTILLAGLAAGVLFLLRHARGGRGADLALAGLGLGIAFGTKWYGPPAVGVVLVAWGAGSLLSRTSPVRLLRQGAALIALVSFAGGFWLLRNLVESGNPLFPQKVEVAGLTVFGAPRDVIRERFDHTVAEYLFDPRVIRDALLPQLRDFLGLPGLVLLLGIALGLASGWAARRAADGRRALMVACAAAILAAVYAITPYSALGLEGRPTLVGENSRYALPALMLGATTAAWAAGRLRRLRPAADLAALAAVALGLGGGYYLAASTIVLVGVAAVAVAGAGYVVVRRTRTRADGPRRKLRSATAGLACVALVGAGYARQRSFNEDRYARVDPAIDWVARNAPSGHRIGLAGRWDEGLSPVLPMFGRRLDNRVAYVGPWRDHLLREYTTRGQFAAAVRRGRYDLLLVGRGRPPRPRTRTERWVAAEGYRPLARSRRLALYRVVAPRQATAVGVAWGRLPR